MFHWTKRLSGLLVPKQKVFGQGRYDAEIFRADELIDKWSDKNLVVNQGLNDNLNCYLNNGSQQASWFLGLFQGNYAPVSSDTAAVIAGNSTECSSYTATTRQQWVPAAPAGQSVTNSAARASFTFNANVTIYGAFLISNNVIGGTTGVLFSGAQFGAAKAVVSGDQLLLTYTFAAASA